MCTIIGRKQEITELTLLKRKIDKYQPKQIDDMYRHMVELRPFSQLEMDTIMDVFRDYMSLGGMPEVVKM